MRSNPDHFAPAQVLHTIAKKGIRDSRFLGVADDKEVRLYRPPPFEKIRTFAANFDPTLAFIPSQIDKPHLNDQAFRLLGEPDKTIKLEYPTTNRLFIGKDSLLTVRKETEKYKIDLDLLIDWLDGIVETDTVKVSREGWLVAIDRLPPGKYGRKVSSGLKQSLSTTVIISKEDPESEDCENM